MQHLVEPLQQDRGSNLHGLGPHGGGSDVRREFDGRLRSRGRVQGWTEGHQLRGISGAEPGVVCASVPGVGVPENRRRASRKRTEMRRRRNV